MQPRMMVSILNVPNKREQNQTCLDSAEREGLRPKGNVPNLRFKEFQGEWEMCKLGDYGKVVTGNTPPTKDVENYENGTFLWASPADLGTIKSISETKTMLSAKGFSKTRALPKGSVLITCIGSTIGKTGMATKEMSTNQQINSIVVNDNSDNEFVYYAIQSAFPRYLSSIAVQAVPIISKSAFELLPNQRPCLQEQKKIGKFLSLLDDRIATQNKIIEDLKKLKSAISENLFKDIKGDIVVLSEICEIIKGKQVNGEFLSEKGKYYVMNGGTYPSGYYSDYNVEANTISISEGGNSCGYIQFNPSPFWSGGHCYTIQKIADDVDNLYLYHYLKSQEDAIMKLRIGSGLPNIQKKDLAMFKIKLPIVEQQKSISTFLSSLERKAEIEEMLLNAMKKEKQYLLRYMFI